MILVGNQRSGARDLAAHLLKDENEHVSVYELRGFVANDLTGALREVEAVSRGTRCKQYLFSLSLNPPPSEQVRTEAFEAAINRAEDRLGLNGQPRAVVFHEKEGRRHAHAVWSRIDAEQMKAVQLSFTRTKLQELSRELYLEHGWELPQGMTDRTRRDPRNFSLDEWQQCQRRGHDPREIKTAIQDAWAMSDSKDALAHALEERGFQLARGDRRGFVALDHNGEPYSIAKYAGIKTKEVRDRLGRESELLSVDNAKDRIARGMIPTMERLRLEAQDKDHAQKKAFEAERQALTQRQRAERELIHRQLEARHWEEARQRQSRFRPGLKGIWDHLRGEHRRIAEQNMREAYDCHLRDRAQRDGLILRHLDQRNALTDKREQERKRLDEVQRQLLANQQRYEAMRMASSRPAFEKARQPQAPPAQARGSAAENSAHPAHQVGTRHIASSHQNSLSRLRKARDSRNSQSARDRDGGPDYSR